MRHPQELLLEEAGLDLAQLRRLSRWGALAPAIGARINPELQRRQGGRAGGALPGGTTVLRRLSDGVASLPRAVLARVSERGGREGSEGVASPSEEGALPAVSLAEGRDGCAARHTCFVLQLWRAQPCASELTGPFLLSTRRTQKQAAF